MWLGVEAGELVCFDETGRPLGDYQTLSANNQALSAALAEAEERATTAEDRLRALEAELRQLRSGE